MSQAAPTIVIDIGNSRIKGALFEENKIIDPFAFAIENFPKDAFAEHLSKKKPSFSLISSVNDPALEMIRSILESQKVPHQLVNFSKLKLKLEVEESEAVGQDRIANAYGALTHFPINDCIIIDIGTAMTIDLVRKDGVYLGGMICPGPFLSAQALAKFTNKLPLVQIKKPADPLGKTTETHIQSGIYYGLLGAIERLIAELKFEIESPSSVKVLATGGALSDENLSIREDLQELVDLIDPHLTLVGLHEMIKEIKEI